MIILLLTIVPMAVQVHSLAQTDSQRSDVARIEMYFQDPELRRAITDQVSDKNPQEITDEDKEHGLREGRWAFNLLDYVTDEKKSIEKREALFSQYVKAIQELKTAPKAPEYPSDKTIHIRLTQKLADAAKDTTKSYSLNAAMAEQIEKIQTLYADALKVRYEQRGKATHEFLEIYAGDAYETLRKVIMKPDNQAVMCCA